MHGKRLRIVGIVVGLIVALLLITGGGGWLWFRFFRADFPQTSGTFALKGLTANVEIYRDSYGVAHIYAENPDDLFFAQGYVHAQERFWQMEFQRRVGSGRLSEILGDATLSTDIYLRTMGFRHLAEQEFEQMSEEDQSVLQSYADGVNAYILSRKPEELGLEFALLKLRGVEFAVEPWSPVDSLVWAHMMVYDQSDKLRTELRNLDVLRAVGAERLADTLPPYPKDHPVIVPDDELALLGNPSTQSAASYFTADELTALMNVDTRLVGGYSPDLAGALYTGNAGSSNSWVISGDLTDTGMPLLANDPHMGIQVPSLWYEVDMHCVEKTDDCPYAFRGFSFPGVPGIVLGHNDKIAWGLTNAQFDSQDIFIERINPDDPDQYEYNGKWVNMETHREEIIVRGQDDPYILTVRSTGHGPMISDNIRKDRAGYDITDDGRQVLLGMSLQWTALRPIRSIEAIMGLIRAQDYNDFREALKKFDAGTQNFIYADVEGHIGYQLPGLIPIRARGDGSLPVPGWTDEYEWTGFIPYDELPRSYDPEKGYIATANNPQVTSDYPYLLNVDVDYGFRAERIVNLIEANNDKITIDDVKAIQRDNTSLPALEIIPALKDLDLEDSKLKAARDLLLDWDGNMVTDSPEAALFNYFWVALTKETYSDQVATNLWPTSGRGFEVMHLLLNDDNQDNPWWDDITTPGITESRDDILIRALQDAYDQGTDEQGDDLSKWQWGNMHTITFVNSPLGQSGIGIVESIFNRGPFPVQGAEQVVNKIPYDITQNYNATTAPAVRYIVDLSNLANTQMIFAPGQSGHPGDPHYDDLIQMWLNFEYHPTLWNRADAEADAKAHMTLTPGD